MKFLAVSDPEARTIFLNTNGCRRWPSCLTVVVWLSASAAFAFPIAYDDWNDGNYAAQWESAAGLDHLVRDNGDLKLTSGNCCGGLGLKEPIDSSVSIRTQARVHSGTIGLAARWGGGPNGNDGYFAWITPAGELDGLVRVEGVETQFDAISVQPPIDAGQDVYFQMDWDKRDRQLSARYWPVNEHPPTEPQWTRTLELDQVIDEGQSGVYVGSDTARSTTTFRYAQVDTRSIPITYDGFDDGNDRGWNRVENAEGSYSIENGEYRMRSAEPLVGERGSAAASLFSIYETAQWLPNSDRPDMRNGMFRAKVRANELGTSIMNGLRNARDTTTYYFSASTDTGEFSIGSFRGSIPGTTHAVSDGLSELFGVGEDWILETATLDNRITMKYWRDGHPEPATPQLVFLDPDPLMPSVRSEPFVGGFIPSSLGRAATLDMTFDDAYYRFVDGWTTGDFSVNEELDVADIDRLSHEVRTGTHDVFFDLTGDGLVDQGDRTFWVKELKGTSFGDANLDGRFDSTDLLTVFQAGQYEDNTPGNSDWQSGDWDGNGDFDTGDLTAAFADGGYTVATVAVPEPASYPASLAVLIMYSLSRSRRRQSLSLVHSN